MAAPAVVLTGSQLPLSMPRTDARQNLVDSITCATVGFMPSLPVGERVNLQEVAICFGGKLLRANRARKLHSSNCECPPLRRRARARRLTPGQTRSAATTSPR